MLRKEKSEVEEVSSNVEVESIHADQQPQAVAALKRWEVDGKDVVVAVEVVEVAARVAPKAGVAAPAVATAGGAARAAAAAGGAAQGLMRANGETSP